MKYVNLFLIMILMILSGCVENTKQIETKPTASLHPEQWSYVWGDEFEYTGLPDSTKWVFETGGHGWGNKELQYYTASRLENSSVENGVLSITAIKEKYEENDYTSTRLISRGKGDFQYGRLEIRAKLPTGRGTWPAIWMMPSDWEFKDGNWPDIGEIDIMEHVGWDPNVVHASAHSRDYQWQKGTQKTGVITVPKATEEFHIYSLEWSVDVMKAFVDDSLYFEYENEHLGWEKWPYDKPFYLILNVAVGGAWGAVKGIDESVFPQSMQVDYVRVYEAKK